MGATINYIFDALHSSKKAIRGIRKSLRNQSRFNLAMVAATIALASYICITETHNHEQDVEIANLKNEIKELNRTKGE